MLFLRPFIQQHRPQIDTCISFVRGMVVSFRLSLSEFSTCSRLMTLCVLFGEAMALCTTGKDHHTLQASPGALYVGNQIHNMIAKVPYLQWFVQPFDGRDNRPRHLL